MFSINSVLYCNFVVAYIAINQKCHNVERTKTEYNDETESNYKSIMY